MGIPITPLGGNDNDQNNLTGQPAPSKNKPDLFTEKKKIKLPPSLDSVEFVNGVKERDLEAETGIIQDKNKILDLQTILNKQSYEEVGNLSVEDVINNDYDTYYSPLQDRVVGAKEFLQDYISRENKTTDVAEARTVGRKHPKYATVKAWLDQALVRYYAESRIARDKDAKIISAMVINEILGLGPIEPLWQDPRITEIMINGPKRTRIEIKGKIITAKGVQFRDKKHLMEVCQQILQPLNKSFDFSHPLADARLNDGSRVNMTHARVGPAGPFVTIRRFPEKVFDMRELVERGAMTVEIAELVGWLVHSGCSIIVSGGTGSGKTSMLNALSGCIPEDERIVTIEDTLELQLHPSRDVIAMEAQDRSPNEVEHYDIRRLVKNALRQHPNRIIVGEVRDASAYDMLDAMNTGHEGSMATVHANDAYGTIDRLVGLVQMAGESSEAQALSLVANGVDIILSVRKYEDGSRRVQSVSEVPSRIQQSERGVFSLEPRTLWEWRQEDTLVDGTITGSYYKVNDLSDQIIKKHRLDKKDRLTIEEIYALSDQVGRNKK